MSPSSSPRDPDGSALVPLFRALDDVETALLQAHPDLPVEDCPEPPTRDDLLASVVLTLLLNLRLAARAYHRERQLASVLPQL